MEVSPQSPGLLNQPAFAGVIGALTGRTVSDTSHEIPSRHRSPGHQAAELAFLPLIAPSFYSKRPTSPELLIGWKRPHPSAMSSQDVEVGSSLP